MDAAFVLVHSPLVGPATWTPVAARLRAAGAIVEVPSLVDVADAPPPFWPRVVELVVAALRAVPAGRPVLLVAHSKAGLFVPLIVEAGPRTVAGCVLVDGALPARSEATPSGTAEMIDFLRPKADDDGRLPPWTTWWEGEPPAEFPAPAEQPRLPFAFYRQMIPVPNGWDRRPCEYLLFGPPYDKVADEARGRGWDVEHLPGHHFHQLVDPEAVAGHLLTLGRKWT